MLVEALRGGAAGVFRDRLLPISETRTGVCGSGGSRSMVCGVAARGAGGGAASSRRGGQGRPRQGAAAASAGASPDAPPGSSPRCCRISFCAGIGSSSIRGMRGGRACGRSGCGGMNAVGVSCSERLGHRRLHEQRRLRRDRADRHVVVAGRRAERGGNRRGRRPARPRTRCDGADRLLELSRNLRRRARRLLDALGEPLGVGAQLLRQLGDAALGGRTRCVIAMWSMPVATTETRMMPSRLSSKVAPTMMLAS